MVRCLNFQPSLLGVEEEIAPSIQPQELIRKSYKYIINQTYSMLEYLKKYELELTSKHCSDQYEKI